MPKTFPNDPWIKIKHRKICSITNHAITIFSSKKTVLTIHKLVGGLLGLVGPWRLSPGTLGARPHGPLAAIAGDQGAQRLSPGAKGPGGYPRGPRGLAAIAGDQGPRRLSLGTKGPDEVKKKMHNKKNRCF